MAYCIKDTNGKTIKTSMSESNDDAEAMCREAQRLHESSPQYAPYTVIRLEAIFKSQDEMKKQLRQETAAMLGIALGEAAAAQDNTIRAGSPRPVDRLASQRPLNGTADPLARAS